MIRRIALLTCVALAAAVATAAAAPAPPDDAVWGSIRVPGGVAALRRVAGLGAGPRVKTSAIIDLTRVSFGTSAKGSPEARGRFLKYVERVVALERALVQWPDGLTLSVAASTDRRERDRLEETLTLLAIRLRVGRDQATVELDRDDNAVIVQRDLQATGIDVAGLVDKLNKGERVRLVMASDEVPLPAPDLWSAGVFRKDHDPFLELVSVPESLWMYYGLMALDSETLEWLTNNPAIFHKIYADRATTFAAFADGVRVRDGQMVLPGGDRMAPGWERLVGASGKDPGKFLLNLLERNDGRLAYLYSTAANLSPDRQAFLLGTAIPEAGRGSDRFTYVETIRDWFVSACPLWDVRLQPFFRPPIDPALVVSLVAIDKSGGVGPDWWPTVLQRAAGGGGWPARPKDTTNALKVQPANAAWFLSFVFEKATLVDQRWALLRFAQRQFASAPKTAAHDVEISLRSMNDMPAFALALERMGLSDPATFADISRAAHRLGQAATDEDAVWALRAWQGSLATLEQVHRHRAVPPDVMQKLVSALARAMPAKPLGPSGHAAAWFLHDVLPALGAKAQGADDTEADILRRILVEAPVEDHQFAWEGVNYRLDTRGPALKSATAIRALVPGPKLQHLVLLDNVARRLTTPVKTLEELAEIRGLVESVLPAWPSDELRNATSAWRRIVKAKDLPKATRERAGILKAIDGITAEVMPSLTYALAMSPTSQPARVFVDSSRLHQLGTREITRRWQLFAWQPGEIANRTAGGVAVRGSLFGIDLARAPDHLSRAPGPVSRPAGFGGAIHEITLNVLAERVVLRAPPNWAAAGADVAAGIDRGRARLAAWRSAALNDGEFDAELVRAGISQMRENQLRWLLEPGRSGAASTDAAQDLDLFFTLTDYFHLGASGDLPAGWGQSARGLDGCWCARGVDRSPIERYRGYTVGYVATIVSDLPLRLAELLDELKIPAEVIEPMLMFAVQDLLDQAAQFVPDDWEPLTWVGAITATRVEDYLQALVARQVLAPPAVR